MTNKKNNYPLVKFCGSVVLLLTITGILMAIGGQLEFLGNERKQTAQAQSPTKKREDNTQKPKYSFYDELKKRKTELEQNRRINAAAGINSAESPSDNYQYVIQVGAFSKRADAKKVMKKVESLGYQARVVKPAKKYLTQAGPFQGKNNAQQVEKRLRNQKMDTLIRRLK